MNRGIVIFLVLLLLCSTAFANGMNIDGKTVSDEPVSDEGERYH